MRVDLVCNDLTKSFDILQIVGEGSYGVVAKCKRKSNGDTVAIKFIKKDGHDKNKQKPNKGLRIDVYREIQILNCLYDVDMKHNINYDYTNNRITKLQQILIGEMQSNKYNLGLVFEYYELSLSQIIRYHRKKLNNKSFDNIFIAKILYQIFEGLNVLHLNWILHRDLKPSNILIDLNYGGVIKLCDFGLSKLFQKYQTLGMHKQQKDGEIVTLYYRPPELFLTKNNNNKYYESPAIDIWSIGCIFAELITLKPLFRIEINQIPDENLNKELLKNICYIMGFPSSECNIYDNDCDIDMKDNNNNNNNKENDLRDNYTWNGVEKLDYYNRYIYGWKLKHNWKPCLYDKVKGANNMQMNLLKKLLMMDPNNRISVHEAMNDKYFNMLGANNGKQLPLFPNGQCQYVKKTKSI